MSETDHEKSGTTPAAKPVKSIQELEQIIAGLPAGTKERAAWEEHGSGNVSREHFRDLWLSLRGQSPKPKTTPNTKNGKPRK